jgi:hypothetical protein
MSDILHQPSADEPARVKRRSFPIVLMSLALALANGIVSVSLIHAKREIAYQSRIMDSLASTIIHKQAIVSGYERVIRRQDLSSEPFGGYDIATSTPWKAEATPDGVYYVISTRCGPCARNLPFLTSVAPSPWRSVLGVSYDDILDLQSYVRDQKITFPVLANPQGRLASLLPGSITPLTLIVSAGRVTDIFFGVLNQDERGAVSEFLSRTTAHRTQNSSTPF